MSHQSVIFSVWLGIAVLALVCAALYLWRTRQLLDQVQQETAATQIRLMPSPVPEFSGASEFTSSAIAS